MPLCGAEAAVAFHVTGPRLLSEADHSSQGGESPLRRTCFLLLKEENPG